jgi:hypothetical protein
MNRVLQPGKILHGKYRVIGIAGGGGMSLQPMKPGSRWKGAWLNSASHSKPAHIINISKAQIIFHLKFCPSS